MELDRSAIGDTDRTVIGGRADLPPFSGDDPTCPKCDNIAACTKCEPVVRLPMYTRIGTAPEQHLGYIEGATAGEVTQSAALLLTEAAQELLRLLAEHGDDPEETG